MDSDLNGDLAGIKYFYPVVEAPNLIHKDPIVLESLHDLKRLCYDFNLPLMYILRGKIVYSNIPLNPDTVYSIYFTNRDGQYFVFYKLEASSVDTVTINEKA